MGEKDGKFKAIAREMQTMIGQRNGILIGDPTPVIEITGCGHAVHVENPLGVITAIMQFIRRLRTN